MCERQGNGVCAEDVWVLTWTGHQVARHLEPPTADLVRELGHRWSKSYHHRLKDGLVKRLAEERPPLFVLDDKERLVAYRGKGAE